MDVKPSREPVPDEFPALCDDLRRAFASWAPGVGAPDRRDAGSWREERFRELALRCFRVQFRGNAPYRRYCERRGVTPASVEIWSRIPPVPTAGFRAVPLVVGGLEQASVEFRTSGTTSRHARRGRHLVRDPELYRASLEPTFRHFVLERGGRTEVTHGASAVAHASDPEPRVRMLSLIPSFAESSRSSLSWMVDRVLERWGTPDSGRAAGPEGLDWTVARRVARAAAEAGEPLFVLTTTLALATWMEELSERDLRLTLPPGSVVMDTGGAKGRSGVARDRVVEIVTERLVVPAGRVVNEFGMTELLSQRYAAAAGPEAGWLRGPPWLRTRAVDPVSLDPLPEGEEGLLCHFDLANAGSVCAVLTEDLGRVREGAVRYGGRAVGAPPRGCSLATAELLEAQEDAGVG